jgi:transcriptional regulator with XRE-family HTH domain
MTTQHNWVMTDDMGNRLKSFRTARKMSQYDLSRQTGIEQATISRIERGEMALLSPHAVKISAALGIPVAGLLGMVENISPVVLGTRQIPVLEYSEIHQINEKVSGLVNTEQHEYVLTDLSYSAKAFAMRILGDSNSPDFTEGDLIVCDPEIFPKPGDWVVATGPGQTVTFAQYRSLGINDNQIELFELVPLNRFYAAMRSDKQALVIKGVMVEHRTYRRK